MPVTPHNHRRWTLPCAAWTSLQEWRLDFPGAGCTNLDLGCQTPLKIASTGQRCLIRGCAFFPGQLTPSDWSLSGTKAQPNSGQLRRQFQPQDFLWYCLCFTAQLFLPPDSLPFPCHKMLLHSIHHVHYSLSWVGFPENSAYNSGW